MHPTPTPLRPELEPLPTRMSNLPIDARGFVVPWFVEWINGVPEFRVMSRDKWRIAVKQRRCWVCGFPLGAHLAFVVGPMCGVNRTTSEPPAHRECAEWSARNCPFLSRPNMVRREDALSEEYRGNAAGVMIDRNPGVTLVWITKRYHVFDDGTGKPLIRMGDPVSVEWFAERRTATRTEILASITSGAPALEAAALAQEQAEGPGALAAVRRQVESFIGAFVPPAAE